MDDIISSELTIRLCRFTKLRTYRRKNPPYYEYSLHCPTDGLWILRANRHRVLSWRGYMGAFESGWLNRNGNVGE